MIYYAKEGGGQRKALEGRQKKNATCHLDCIVDFPNDMHFCPNDAGLKGSHFIQISEQKDEGLTRFDGLCQGDNMRFTIKHP